MHSTIDDWLLKKVTRSGQIFPGKGEKNWLWHNTLRTHNAIICNRTDWFRASYTMWWNHFWRSILLGFHEIFLCVDLKEVLMCFGLEDLTKTGPIFTKWRGKKNVFKFANLKNTVARSSVLLKLWSFSIIHQLLICFDCQLI